MDGQNLDFRHLDKNSQNLDSYKLNINSFDMCLTKSITFTGPAHGRPFRSILSVINFAKSLHAGAYKTHCRFAVRTCHFLQTTKCGQFMENYAEILLE